MLNSRVAIGAALAGAFVLGAVAVGFSSAQTDREREAASVAETVSHAPSETSKVSTSFSDTQEEEIGALVRAYLIDNPEVIIEAVNLYSERQRMASEEQARLGAAENIHYLTDPETSFVTGKRPDTAKVSVIELYDYHCGYCKRAANLMKDMVKSEGDVKLVFRELPLLKQESFYAAEMSLAAREQGKFLDLHFAMLATSGTLTKERVQDIAREQGLDVKKMEAAITDQRIPEMVANNRAMAEALDIDYTPAFIIASNNGEFIEVVSGFQPELLREKIKEAKDAAG